MYSARPSCIHTGRERPLKFRSSSITACTYSCTRMARLLIVDLRRVIHANGVFRIEAGHRLRGLGPVVQAELLAGVEDDVDRLLAGHAQQPLRGDARVVERALHPALVFSALPEVALGVEVVEPEVLVLPHPPAVGVDARLVAAAGGAGSAARRPRSRRARRRSTRTFGAAHGSRASRAICATSRFASPLSLALGGTRASAAAASPGWPSSR